MITTIVASNYVSRVGGFPNFFAVVNLISVNIFNKILFSIYLAFGYEVIA
jgi:hypothetical protein